MPRTQRPALLDMRMQFPRLGMALLRCLLSRQPSTLAAGNSYSRAKMLTFLVRNICPEQQRMLQPQQDQNAHLPGATRTLRAAEGAAARAALIEG